MICFLQEGLQDDRKTAKDQQDKMTNMGKQQMLIIQGRKIQIPSSKFKIVFLQKNTTLKDSPNLLAITETKSDNNN